MLLLQLQKAQHFPDRTQCTTITTNSEKVEFRAESVFNL